MRQEDADRILAVLDENWSHGTPASEYPGKRCLGMAISDGISGPAREVMAEVEEQVRRLYPGRANAPRPLLPAFQCCGSDVIPSFNGHPDTCLADARRVVAAAVR